MWKFFFDSLRQENRIFPVTVCKCQVKEFFREVGGEIPTPRVYIPKRRFRKSGTEMES